MSETTTQAPSKGDRNDAIRWLTEQFSGLPDGRRRKLIEEMITTSLRLGHDDAHTGELKLINAALKEMRYANTVFKPWADRSKISIFGSARTPEDHPDYQAARKFSELMGEA